MTARPEPVRTRLPDERQSITHKFDVGGHEGYLIVGLYENGQPGELFIKIAKEGSTIGGLMDTIGILVSLALQYGVPLEHLCRKLKDVSFEPSGLTFNKDIPQAKSIVDYIFRWLELWFLTRYNKPDPLTAGKTPAAETTAQKANLNTSPSESSGDTCPDCGWLMIFQEGCMLCRACGYTKC